MSAFTIPDDLMARVQQHAAALDISADDFVLALKAHVVLEVVKQVVKQLEPLDAAGRQFVLGCLKDWVREETAHT